MIIHGLNPLADQRNRHSSTPDLLLVHADRPWLKAIAASSLPMRISLMTLLFLLMIWLAAAIKLFWTETHRRADIFVLPWFGGALLFVIVIPIIAYYLTKYLLIREESRYPKSIAFGTKP